MQHQPPFWICLLLHKMQDGGYEELKWKLHRLDELSYFARWKFGRAMSKIDQERKSDPRRRSNKIFIINEIGIVFENEKPSSAAQTNRFCGKRLASIPRSMLVILFPSHRLTILWIQLCNEFQHNFLGFVWLVFFQRSVALFRRPNMLPWRNSASEVETPSLTYIGVGACAWPLLFINHSENDKCHSRHRMVGIVFHFASDVVWQLLLRVPLLCSSLSLTLLWMIWHAYPHIQLKTFNEKTGKQLSVQQPYVYFENMHSD